MIIYFFTGLCFGGLGLAAYLQNRQAGDFPLQKHLPCLAAFGFVYGATSWIDMFIAGQVSGEVINVLKVMKIVSRPLAGFLLIKFGWGVFGGLSPLPSWMIFLPGILIVPIAYIVTYAATTFITSSPLEIPVEIWSRYLLYLPGSILSGIGFLRQWHHQREEGLTEAARLMLGASFGFLIEAVIVGLVVPAAPYGPASYYNYDRVVHNAFLGEHYNQHHFFGLINWLDYQRVLDVTGVPIEFWRLISAVIVTYFVVRGLGVFETIRKRKEFELRKQRDTAQDAAIKAEISARENAEQWTEALVNINRRIVDFGQVDSILLSIVENTRLLLHSDFVGLSLWDDENECLSVKCYSTSEESEIVLPLMKIENPVLEQAFQKSLPYRSRADEDRESFEGLCLSRERKAAHSVGVVPIQLVDDTTIGVMWMSKCEEGLYSETDLIWLESMADQVVITVQHGIMTSQLQSSSIVGERMRIAREMHDSLAQVLGYLNLQVQTLESLHEQAKTTALMKELGHMKEAIRAAHADVRENILSLRTTLADEKGLLSAIGEYLEEFEIQTGIKVDFVNQLKVDINIASVTEVQLVCILQEALANVRKHAGAEKVLVEISQFKQGDQGFIRMIIKDDGVGFMVSESKRSFGLETMRERAHSVEGDLQVNSSPGKGTTVLCVLPSLQQEDLREPFIALS